MIFLRWVMVILVVFSGSATASLKVTQRVLLEGPSADSVQVLGIEEPEKLPRLRFSDFTESKVQFIELGKSDPDFPRPFGGCHATDTFMRFRQLHVRGFPDPLVLAVVVSPGGSDTAYYSTFIARIGDEFKVINPEPFSNNEEGGLYIGYINKKFGPGVVAWESIWGNGEAHYDPHRYTIRIFTWDKGGHCLHKRGEITTKKKYKYESRQKALAELGLPSRNVIDTVVDGEVSTLGCEEAMAGELEQP